MQSKSTSQAILSNLKQFWVFLMYRGLPALGPFTVRLQGLPPLTKLEDVQATGAAAASGVSFGRGCAPDIAQKLGGQLQWLYC